MKKKGTKYQQVRELTYYKVKSRNHENVLKHLDEIQQLLLLTLITSKLSRFCHLEFGSSDNVINSSDICSTDLNSAFMNSSSSLISSVDAGRKMWDRNLQIFSRNSLFLHDQIPFCSYVECFLCKHYLSRLMTKPTKWHVHQSKTQISLGIRLVWSESLLSAWRKLGSLATHWEYSKDSDQTGRMPRLIWVFAGRKGYFVGFLMTWLIYSIIFTDLKASAIFYACPPRMFGV